MKRRPPKGVSAFLRAWAEEICVELQLAMESGSPAALDADGARCSWTAQGLPGRILPACRRCAAYPDCGLVLLAEDDRTAIDVYQCHPNALVPKPVTYSGLDAAMERCFSFWQKGLGWLDLPRSTGACISRCISCSMPRRPGRSSVLYRAGGALQVNCALSALEESLPQPPFLRVQKSFVVHLGRSDGCPAGSLSCATTG